MHSSLPRWDISSHYLTTTYNQISTQGEIFMVSIVIQKKLDPNYLDHSRSALSNFSTSSSTKMINKLSSQLLQIYALDRRISVNAVEYLDTRLMHSLSMDLTSYHQVLQ